jgi:hypothetical protein
LATDTLIGGLDSQSLRELAGKSNKDDAGDLRDLFNQALSEIKIQPPPEQDALWVLARHFARQLVSGEIEPYVGARWIWAKTAKRVEKEGDLRIFVGLASEWDDHPSFRNELDDRIIDAGESATEHGSTSDVGARHGAS